MRVAARGPRTAEALNNFVSLKHQILTEREIRETNGLANALSLI